MLQIRYVWCIVSYKVLGYVLTTGGARRRCGFHPIVQQHIIFEILISQDTTTCSPNYLPLLAPAPPKVINLLQNILNPFRGPNVAACRPAPWFLLLSVPQPRSWSWVDVTPTPKKYMGFVDPYPIAHSATTRSWWDTAQATAPHLRFAFRMTQI